MDWDRYRQLERDADDLMRAAPVALDFDEFLELKNIVLLLRRILGDTDGNSDLDSVERRLDNLGGRIYDAFRETPGVADLRAEQMRMLERGATTPGQTRSGIPESTERSMTNDR